MNLYELNCGCIVAAEERGKRGYIVYSTKQCYPMAGERMTASGKQLEVAQSMLPEKITIVTEGSDVEALMFRYYCSRMAERMNNRFTSETISAQFRALHAHLPAKFMVFSRRVTYYTIRSIEPGWNTSSETVITNSDIASLRPEQSHSPEPTPQSAQPSAAQPSSESSWRSAYRPMPVYAVTDVAWTATWTTAWRNND